MYHQSVNLPLCIFIVWVIYLFAKALSQLKKVNAFIVYEMFGLKTFHSTEQEQGFYTFKQGLKEN